MVLTIWSSLGVLTDYFDITQFFTFGESYIQGTVFTGFFNGKLGTESFLQTSIMMMLIMGYVASAYVITCSISAGVSVTRAFYATYAGFSDISNLLYLFEVVMILSFQGWGFWKAILVTILASQIWNQVDRRVAEAQADSKGYDTPISWELAIKTSTLTMIVGVMILVAGFSLGDIADDAISWISNYDDDTKTEGDDKTTGD